MQEPLVKETWKLNDGREIPVLGIGVFKVENDVAKSVVQNAIAAGIRLIDTAQAYRNEEGVGEGVLLSGIPREQLFITTKVANTEQGYESALASVRQSLQRLQLAYLDLVLIHWPIPSKDQYVETYRALEKLRADGWVRSIGVSNFQREHLLRLMQECETAPALNQIELHPYLTNAPVATFCRENGIAVQAWSPIAKGQALQDELIAGIALRHQKSPAQVVLRWHYQNGVLTIPKSVHTARILENADIFDFALSAEEMDAINGLNRDYRTGPDPDLFGSD